MHASSGSRITWRALTTAGSLAMMSKSPDCNRKRRPSRGETRMRSARHHQCNRRATAHARFHTAPSLRSKLACGFGPSRLHAPLQLVEFALQLLALLLPLELPAQFLGGRTAVIEPIVCRL